MNIRKYFRNKKEQDAVLKMPFAQILRLWCICFICISILAYLSDIFYATYASPLITASFGATTIILFAIPTSPFSRARSAIGGHILSAFVGVCFFQLFGYNAFAAGMAVATALALMLLTDTLHPPCGATALNVFLGGSFVQDLGFVYVLLPSTVGPIFLFLISKLYHKFYEV